MIHSTWWFVRDDHRGGLGAARPIGPVPSGSFVIRKRAGSRRRPGSRRGRASVSGPRLRRRRRDRDDALLDQGRGLELVIKAAGLRGVDRRGHDVNALGAARFGGFARGAAGARSDPNGSRGRAAHTACAKLRGARRRRRSTRHGRLDERRLATRLKPRLAANQILSALRARRDRRRWRARLGKTKPAAIVSSCMRSQEMIASRTRLGSPRAACRPAPPQRSDRAPCVCT